MAEVTKDVERIRGISRLLLRKQWQLSGTSCSYRTQTVDTDMSAVIPDAMSPGQINLYAGARYLRLLCMDLAFCHLSSERNFQMAFRFLANL